MNIIYHFLKFFIYLYECFIGKCTKPDLEIEITLSILIKVLFILHVLAIFIGLVIFLNYSFTSDIHISPFVPEDSRNY